MRSTKDRRDSTADAIFPLEDSNHEVILEDRRRKKERRLENLDMDERQLLLSEMPSPSSIKPR
jgi:hypothetical protein